MWWYRDSQRSPAAPARPGSSGGSRAAAPAAAGPAARPPLVEALAQALAARPRDPDAWLAMSLLADSRIELADGSVSDGMTWHDAERTVADALGGDEPVRLYNRFSREFGDGYTLRADLPSGHARALAALRDALAGSDAVTSIAPRADRAS